LALGLYFGQQRLSSPSFLNPHVARRLLALALLLIVPRLLPGQQSDSARSTPWAATWSDLPGELEGLQEPAVLRAPWLGAARAARAGGLRNLLLYGSSDQTPPEGEEERRPLGIAKRYADLALEGEIRLELRSDRLRNERCTPIQLLDPGSGCRGGFRAPRLDNHVSLRSGGLLGRRVHLNIDYDNDRDFDANNDLQVYYEGLEDEIVRRIEVGTVTFLPPRSRFITAAVPANSFGVNAQFEMGPVQVQTLAATQKGSRITERTYTIGETTSQAQERDLRDLDFESGRFYWVVDPTGLPGYPALDILNLAEVPVAPATRPVQVRVYRFRHSTTQTGNANVGGITATARTTDPNQSYGPVQWELLIEGSDYYLDPSGLWFVLAAKLEQSSYLAVSYITAGGQTVGSFPSDDQGAGSTDSLRLVVEPTKGPEAVTFRHEMRQVYRVAGTDLDPASLQVSVALNNSERPLSGGETYLALLGLSVPADPTVLDRENRLFPRAQDPQAGQVAHESYIVYPHLTPFADPNRLSPAERADSIYRTPLYLLLQQTASKFRIRLRYNSTGAGDRSTLNLGQLQVREGSEQLEVRGRRLERDVDYTMAYDIGQVTFLNPQALFGDGPVQVKARFEVQELFAAAPTTILGLSTSYALGEVGAVNVLGLYQTEQSAFNRPQLGFEASANLVGGINTELHFKPNGVTRLLNQLVDRPSTAPSLLDLNGEFAFTQPDPNRSGEAYIEEFESDAGINISLGETAWGYGSIPQSAAGVEDLGFGAGFDREDAVALTWQNLVPSTGNRAFELRPADIDTLIRITRSTDQRETALFFTFHADTAGGIVQADRSSRWSLPQRDFRPRWRSMVAALSTTGVDLSNHEFLEFWVFQPGSRTTDSAGVRLVFDLGNVNEDALAIAPDAFTPTGADTVFTGRQYVGADAFDTERSSINSFDAQVDDVGILGDRPAEMVDLSVGVPVADLPLCQRLLQTAVPLFPWGDLSSRCTRGNGVLDTEDLNGDNGLNSAGADEDVFRYVVSLQPGSKYYVRDGVQSVDTSGRVSKWELYRIPVRSPDAVIGSPNLRLVQQLRLTVVGAQDAGTPDVVSRWALARLHFVGTSWIRRSNTPIAGLAGSAGKATGEVIASTVSTENRSDLGYESPPGVVEGLARRGDVGSSGVQINERSLRLVARGLDVGDRAEAYLRFPAGPQNVLAYRQFRVWARGRGAGWEENELQAFVKLGSDDRNFYAYRASARSTTWEPEMVVDLETWRRLRAQIEQRWLQGEQPSGADVCGTNDPTAYVACEDGYLVHVGDPGINPPNLASAQEVSVGLYRAAGVGTAGEAELWIDDIRLSSPLSETGTAVALDARMVASDVGSIAASYTRQDGQFRQINTDPTYRTTGTLQLDTRWQLDRFLPAALGITLPFSVTHARSDVDPQLLTGSDLRGSALPGLRRPLSRSTTYALALRRSVKGTNWLTRGLADPLTLTSSLTQGRAESEFTTATSNTLSLGLGYNLQMRRRGFRLPLGGVIGSLPGWVRESEAGKGLRDATVSLVPTTLRFTSALARDRGEQRAFSVPITRPDDALIRPTVALNHLWRNSAGFTWQPLGMLSLSSDLSSTRDLRVYSDSTTLGRLAYAERRFLLGVPVGVERDRTLSTTLTVAPRITSWLALRAGSSSSSILSRSLASRAPVRSEVDSGAFILPQTLNNVRSWETGSTLDLGRAVRNLWGDSSGVARALGRIRPLELARRVSRNSTFDLTAFDPSLGYMLAFGGLARFLQQEGSEARGAGVTRTTSVATGADLPFGISGSISYSLTRSDRYQQVGEGSLLSVARQREWPVGNVRVSRVFRTGPLSLVSTSLNFRRREGGSSQPSQAEGGAQSAISSSSLRPDLQLGFRNGMSLSFTYGTLEQRTFSSGNTTLLDQEDLSGSFSHSFRLPELFGRSRRQVRSSVTAVVSNVRSCLERRVNPECRTISDVRRREFSGGLDADVVGALTAGLQVNYSLNDARHISQRTSQISLLASFQWSFDAGSGP
jgi:hypothetical protein